MRTAVIIGGGLVGLASAYKLQLGGRYSKVILLEKEPDVGQHQSTHNSGVLHAGLYYAPGSSKARFAVRGLREMVAFCRENGIAHEQCGKVVVATSENEAVRLRALFSRGLANGLQGLQWLDARELRAFEPYANGTAAVLVPEEGIVDYAEVCRTLRRLILIGGAMSLSTRPFGHCDVTLKGGRSAPGSTRLRRAKS